MSVLGEQLFSLQHPKAPTNTSVSTKTPLVVFGQDNAESSVIVGGVVDDFLCVRNTDIDCIHYLRCEVTPVKYLQVQKHRETGQKAALKRGRKVKKKQQILTEKQSIFTWDSTSRVKLVFISPSSILL